MVSRPHGYHGLLENSLRRTESNHSVFYCAESFWGHIMSESRFWEGLLPASTRSGRCAMLSMHRGVSRFPPFHYDPTPPNVAQVGWLEWKLCWNYVKSVERGPPWKIRLYASISTTKKREYGGRVSNEENKDEKARSHQILHWVYLERGQRATILNNDSKPTYPIPWDSTLLE